jgi:hypothetical protein
VRFDLRVIMEANLRLSVGLSRVAKFRYLKRLSPGGGALHGWLRRGVFPRSRRVKFLSASPEKAQPDSKLEFRQWPEALAASPLPTRIRESYAITIRWYLSWCRRRRIDNCHANFGSSRSEAAELDIRQLLRRIVQGEAVTPSSNRALGCPFPGVQ